MNLAEFTKILFPVNELYGRELSPAALQLYFEDVEFLDAETFRALLKKHRASEQGVFYPTFGHLVQLTGTENDAGIHAGIQFDKNPRIDKTGHFDIQNETQVKTATRRKKYIESQKLEWKKLTPEQKFSCSNLLPNLNQTKPIEDKS